MKTNRRKSRELALQTLYAFNMQNEGKESKAVKMDDLKNELIFKRNVKQVVAEYASDLIDIERKHQRKIGNILAATSENWDIDRFSQVDKALLRIAIGELLYFPDVPVKVVINEALEVARMFSTDESVSFINGILDKVSSKWRKNNIVKKAGEVVKS